MRWTFMLTATAAWTMAGTALYLLAPLAAPVVLMLAVVAPLVWYRWQALGPPAWKWSPLPVLLALAAVYLLANSMWSLTPGVAHRGAAMLLIVAGVSAVLTAIVPRLEDAPVRAMSVGFFAA